MSAGAADHAPVREATPRTYYEEVVRTPGMHAPPDRCRGLDPVGFCEHGHTILGRSSCGTRYCEDHWRDWCEDAAVSAVARMAAFREAREGAERPSSHVVASPPQDRRYSTRALWETRSEAYEALQETGAGGGVVVTHPYRTNDRADALYATARELGAVEEDTGRWRFLRDVADDWEDMSQYVEAAPHYHAVVPTNYVDGEAAPEGWVVKNIRRMQAFERDSLETYRDMVGAVYYVLTHGGVQDGRQMVTYYGDVHPASFKPEEELSPGVWRKIRRMAERAVKGGPPGEESEGEECPHEGCEAVVHELVKLRTKLESEEWAKAVRAGRGGRARWLRLRGVLAWHEGRTDRPPPSAATSEARMRSWLEERGAVLTPRESQVGLGRWGAES